MMPDEYLATNWRPDQFANLSGIGNAVGRGNEIRRGNVVGHGNENRRGNVVRHGNEVGNADG